LTDTADVRRLVSAVLDAAQRAIDQGRWDDASVLARQVLEVVPREPTATALLRLAEVGPQGAADQGRRFLTVLFSDVVGSTALSERLDPEDYFAVIATYRELVRDVIAQHRGHIDQFQGDGVLAYFGFPVAAEDDQVRAVEAGLEIVHRVPEVGARIGVDLASRVGVHVGRTVLTSSGLDARERSTAIGYATNVAARIQGVAEPGTVVVSETAFDAISPYFNLEPVGAQSLRGVSEDVRVFRVFEPRPRSTMSDDRLTMPLVGRHEERTCIDDAWRAVRAGSDGRLVMVEGEPGIGKSRLARFAIDQARAEAARVIEINCGRGFRHVGLGALRRGVEKALGLGSTPAREEISAALAARAREVGLSDASLGALDVLMVDGPPRMPIPQLPADHVRDAIISALLEWISAEAAHAPVVLVVEDVHWADDIAVETLRRLTSRSLPAGLLVLVTVRTGGMPQPLEQLLRDAIELGPLTTGAAREMVRAVAHNQDLDDAVVEALVRRGEGVPLFTEHLVMASTSESSAPGSPSEALPETLEGLLQARLDATGPGRALAEVAAVVGREFTLELVERALLELGDRAPLRLGDVPGALRALQRAGLVESYGPGITRFHHSLVRDAAYELQLRTERPRRHDAVAKAILSLHGPDASPEAVAFHLEQAGDLEPAAGAYLRAAEAAAALAQFDAALDHLCAAGAIIDQLDGPSARRLDLARCMQIGSVSAASFSYARTDAERSYLRALELCDLISADEGPGGAVDVQLMAALGGLWSKEVVAGDLTRARAVTDRLERLLLTASADLKPEIRRFVLSCRGFESLYGGTTTDAVATLTEASMINTGPVALPLGRPHDYVAAIDALLGAALALAGDDAGADEALERALKRTAVLPFPLGPFSEAVVQVYCAYVHRLRRDTELASAAAKSVAEIGDRHGFREHSMIGQLLVLAASAAMGDRDACEAVETTLHLWRMTGGGLAVPTLLTELAEGCARGGDSQRARAILDDAATMMADTDQRSCEPEIIRIGALLEHAAGAPVDDVVKQLQNAAELALECGAVRLAGRAVRDALFVLEGRLDVALADVAQTLCERVPASAVGDLREVERLVNAWSA
jgi:class 3 adenylate cyclase